ncbi:MAG: DUF177 domain-containing protein [Planctomycetota bacterium]
MQISVPRLRPGRHVFRSSLSPAEYEAPAAGSGLDFRGTIDVVATAHKMGGQLFVRTDAHTTVAMECARCLEPFIAPLAATSSALYVPEETFDRTGSRAHAIESESERVFYYRQGVVDLGEQVVDSLVLAAPMKPLCREDCRGLCPVCGQNLNEGTCNCCPGEDFGHPFRDLLR